MAYEVYSPWTKTWMPTDEANYKGFQSSDYTNAGWQVRDTGTTSSATATTTPITAKTTAPSTTTTATTTSPINTNTQPTTNNLTGLRDYFEGKGYKVGYNDQTGVVDVNGSQIDTSGLSLQNGRYMGTMDQIRQLESNLPQNRTTENYLDPMEEEIKKNNPQIYGTQPTNNNTTIVNANGQEGGIPVYTSTRAQSVEDILNDIGKFNPQYRAFVESLLQQMGKPFEYNSSEDTALAKAQQQAQQSVMKQMNSRGILNSTITADRSAQVTADLVPVYEKMAYDRYQNNISNLFKQADFLNKLDVQDYNKYIDEVNIKLKQADFLNTLDQQDYQKYKDNLANFWKVVEYKDAQREAELKAQEAKIKKAMDKVNVLGYVDNEASIILGLPVGTLSEKAREAQDKLQIDIELEKKKAEIDLIKKEQEFNNTMKKLEYEEGLKRTEKEYKEAQSNNLAKVVSTISTLTPQEALQVIQANSEAIINAAGGENFNKLVADLIKRRDEGAKQAFDESETTDKKITSAIKSSSSKYGVDEALVKAIIRQESNYNPKAQSSAGAQGLMQLMPGTAKDLGVTNPFDATQNIDGGTKYISQLLQRYGGDIDKALAAYNAGMGNVDAFNGIPPYSETQNYVKKVKEYYNQYKDENLTSTEKKNQDFAKDYKILKSLSVAEAKKQLTEKKSEVIAMYGLSGYKNLWNTVLAEAIQMGQAESLK